MRERVGTSRKPTASAKTCASGASRSKTQRRVSAGAASSKRTRRRQNHVSKHCAHPSRLAPVEVVAPDRLDVMAPGVNQGVAAELKPRRDWTLKELLATNPSLLVALDSIMDPQNLGAILRSAEAAGADGVVLPERRSAPLSAAAVKASSGASEHLRLARVAGLPSAVAEIRRHGIWCVALDPRGELLPWEFDLTQPVCLVVGGEGHGVHRLVRERSDARVRLPMAGRVASLNASAAAAALLYEAMRQRSSR
ncbi:MAG: 23S rRNA (guanosine(2251)-2'-O)-methyltransferase RlmB [Chloroflexi bacterium]|nr:MAG: 23S rRNA (guanosine(2251)-2'-O)-methyltransferase RlmB [Chloroflexota bacterium]